MSIQTNAPSYVLGQSADAEFRLELLNELTSDDFVHAMNVLPNHKVRILILGCGSGHLEARLSEVFTESHFIGIDNSAKRIEEARARTGVLKGSNTFEYIEADLTTFAIEKLKTCDIFISRFVLMHLSQPLIQLNRFFPIVRSGGFVCLEEGASIGTEYYCNTDNGGYKTFVSMVNLQIQTQKSSFDIGFSLLSELIDRRCEILYNRIELPILRSARHKSIFRLGVQEARSGLLKDVEEKEMEELITSLSQFEDNERAYGLYTRFIAMIAQVP